MIENTLTGLRQEHPPCQFSHFQFDSSGVQARFHLRAGQTGQLLHQSNSRLPAIRWHILRNAFVHCPLRSFQDLLFVEPIARSITCLSHSNTKKLTVPPPSSLACQFFHIRVGEVPMREVGPIIPLGRLFPIRLGIPFRTSLYTKHPRTHFQRCHKAPVRTRSRSLGNRAAGYLALCVCRVRKRQTEYSQSCNNNRRENLEFHSSPLPFECLMPKVAIEPSP